MLVKLVSGIPAKTATSPRNFTVSNLDKGRKKLTLSLFERIIEDGVIKSVDPIDLTEADLSVRLVFPNDIQHNATPHALDADKGIAEYTFVGDEFEAMVKNETIEIHVFLLKSNGGAIEESQYVGKFPLDVRVKDINLIP